MRTKRIPPACDGILAAFLPTSRMEQYRAFLVTAMGVGCRIGSNSELRRRHAQRGILTDPAFRQECGIELAAYDPAP